MTYQSAVVLLGGLGAAFVLSACSGDDAVESAAGSDESGGTSGSMNLGGSSNGSTGTSAETAGFPVTVEKGGGSGASGAGGAPAAGGSQGGNGGTGGGEGGIAPCNTSLGKALQFDGKIVDLMTGDLGADFPGGDTARTIELWAKYISADSWLAEASIMDTGLRINAANQVLGIDNSGYTAGTMTAEFGPYTNGYSDNNHPSGIFVMNIPQTGWVHLSWSYTGNHGTLHFVVNGEEQAIKTQAGQATMDFTPGIVTLGAAQFGTNGWTGVMDEVRIWSVARTAAEIKQNMRVVLSGNEPGLVAYYRFDEGSGDFTDDVSKKMSRRLSTCTAKSTRCAATNSKSPTWVNSDIPAPGFTCAQ